MIVQGRDCGLVVRVGDGETALPYCEETIREKVCLLTEEAAIEGDGLRRALRVSAGVTGCVVTPLTMGTAPVLLALAFGEAGEADFVSETQGLYRRGLKAVSAEDSLRFDLVQDRGAGGKLYEGCKVTGFELRIMRGEALKLRLDIEGKSGIEQTESYEGRGENGAERFKEDGVRYFINGARNWDIYGLTVAVDKSEGVKTEITIHRILRDGYEFPPVIENLSIIAELFRDKYEERERGRFFLHFSKLLLEADQTAVDSSGAVAGVMRYWCEGMGADVFTASP
jgi:hypothetical protein